jgi:hypothetical protein
MGSLLDGYVRDANRRDGQLICNNPRITPPTADISSCDRLKAGGSVIKLQRLISTYAGTINLNKSKVMIFRITDQRDIDTIAFLNFYSI